jgi:putative N6-adenine-specific DNA methylase
LRLSGSTERAWYARRDFHWVQLSLSTQSYFSPCPRGLEPVLATELASCGAEQISQQAGGVAYVGSLETGYRVNLWSRVASRVLRKVTEGPYRNEQDLYALAHAQKWRDWFDVKSSIRVDVTAIKSPLQSLDFATLRVKDAICDRFRDEIGSRPDVNTRTPDVRVSVFLTADRATVYLDTSGEPLFKRGYRPEAGDAPIKENLAAGIIALSGWQADQPFFDPMCGGGTFVFEATLQALNIAPGTSRDFGFERLLDFDATLWSRLREEAHAGERRSPGLTIVGSDIQQRAIERARTNALRANLVDVVRFEVADVLTTNPPAPSGVVITNPPYGVRVGEIAALDEMYPKLGAALKARFSGWNCFFITADLRLPKMIRLKESRRTPLFNGPLECRLFEFRMVAGSNR